MRAAGGDRQWRHQHPQKATAPAPAAPDAVFTLTIARRSHAFGENDNQERSTISRVLTEAAQKVGDGVTRFHTIRDANNEAIGAWSFGPASVTKGA